MRDRSMLKRIDSMEIIAILERIGWHRVEKKQRVQPYGIQYVFECEEPMA